MALLYFKKLKKKNNNEKLLDSIAEVYADFNYPKDMENFIYYMPRSNVNEGKRVSVEENRKKLIERFDDFLNKEKDYLSQLG